MKSISISCPKCVKTVNLKFVGNDKSFKIYQCPNCELPIRFKNHN